MIGNSDLEFVTPTIVRLMHGAVSTKLSWPAKKVGVTIYWSEQACDALSEFVVYDNCYVKYHFAQVPDFKTILSKNRRKLLGTFQVRLKQAEKVKLLIVDWASNGITTFYPGINGVKLPVIRLFFYFNGTYKL